MTVLESVLQQRDTVGLLDLLCRLVPEYHPSEALLEGADALCVRQRRR